MTFLLNNTVFQWKSQILLMASVMPFFQLDKNGLTTQENFIIDKIVILDNVQLKKVCMF